MSVSSGPKVIKNGLVFEYDMENIQKSWKGKPLTNYYDTISTSSSLRGSRTQHFWDGYHWVVNATYSDPGVSGPDGVYLGLVYKHTSGALSSSWSGNSYGYMLKDIASTSGSTYTMSVWTYMSSDCNIDQLPCSTEGATTPNITVSGYPTQYNTGAKGTWQQLARSAVSDGNVRWIPVYPAKWGVTDGSFTGFFMWAAAQVEDGSIVSAYAGDDTSYARSTTQSVVDLTGQNTITANSLTYNSDGTFSFDGSANYLSAGAGFSNFTSGITISAWAYFNSSTGNWVRIVDFGNGNPLNNFLFCRYSSSNNLFWGIYPGSSSVYTTGSTISWDSWAMYTATADGSNMKIYKNGILEVTYPTSTLPDNVTRNNNYIGKSNWADPYYDGQISNVKIYNRALTEGEVRLNFNALRGRYGI